MNTALTQKLGQTLVLSPQLQQSLAVLAAPVLELRALVSKELESNPLLESVSDVEESVEARETREDMEAAMADPHEPPLDVQYDPAKEPAAEDSDFDKELRSLLELDRDLYDSQSLGSLNTSSDADEERRQFMLDSAKAPHTLQEELEQQVQGMLNLTYDARDEAMVFTQNIDERGYLNVPSDLFTEHFIVSMQMVLEPPGIGARSLRESLRIQTMRHANPNTLALSILDWHFELLSKRKFNTIAEILGLDYDEVCDACAWIAKLNPYPAAQFYNADSSVVTPELDVVAVAGVMEVHQRSDYLPNLRISSGVARLVTHAATDATTRDYIREKIRAGKFFIRSIHQRQNTILRVATEIVRRQHNFFASGNVLELLPLTMSQVADAVGVHETTVSRAVSGKYMSTPHGVLELRYFFSCGVANASGVDTSNRSVKLMLVEIIAGEDKKNPYSDEALVAVLNSRGMCIARRTAAKYRAEHNILPRHLRVIHGT